MSSLATDKHLHLPGDVEKGVPAFRGVEWGLRGQRGDPVLTVNQPLQVVVTTPEERRLVHGRRVGRERASPDAAGARGAHGLLLPLLLPAAAFVRRLTG